MFDDAVSELPLKAERAAEAKRREKAPLDVGAGSPEGMTPQEPAPKRRSRIKAES